MLKINCCIKNFVKHCDFLFTLSSFNSTRRQEIHKNMLLSRCSLFMFPCYKLCVVQWSFSIATMRRGIRVPDCTVRRRSCRHLYFFFYWYYLSMFSCPTHLQSLCSLDICYEFLEISRGLFNNILWYDGCLQDGISFLDHKDRCYTFVYSIKLILYVLEWRSTTTYICPPHQFNLNNIWNYSTETFGLS